MYSAYLRSSRNQVINVTDCASNHILQFLRLQGQLWAVQGQVLHA